MSYKCKGEDFVMYPLILKIDQIIVTKINKVSPKDDKSKPTTKDDAMQLQASSAMLPRAALDSESYISKT